MKNSDCIRSSITFMTATGVWLPDSWSGHPMDYYYIIFAIAVQGTVFFSVVIAEIAYVFTVIGHTELTVDASVLLMSHLVQGVKVGTIWFRRDRIKRLISMIDGPEFTRSDPVKRQILDSTITLGKIVGKLVISAAGVTAIFWSIVPLLKAEKSLPLKTVFPFDSSQSPMFEIMYIHLALSVGLVGIGDAAENYLVAGLLVLSVAQLDVLCHELRNVGRKDKPGSVYEEAVACVKYHQKIINFVEELASVFGLTIFCQFITTGVVLCMTVFKITISREPIELTTMFFYLICVFMELLMYCYPGDMLINKSLEVSQAAYSADWVNSDVPTRRVLLLTVLRAQRPLGVHAGGVYRVSLPAAAGVVQTSYSYYAMLKQAQNN